MGKNNLYRDLFEGTFLNSKKLLISFSPIFLIVFLLNFQNIQSQINRELEVKIFTNVIDNPGSPDGIISEGDEVNFTIVVTNKGNINLNSLVLSSTLLGIDNSILSLVQSITYFDSTASNASGFLIPGEQETYKASYQFSDIQNTLGLSFSVLGEAISADNVNVSDTSDDANNTDGNTEDDPNIISKDDDIASIEVNKIFEVTFLQLRIPR